MPHEECLRLNNQEGLPPGPNSPCQKHHQDAICFRIYWPFHLSAKNDELLPQECVFCHKFGPASGKICYRPKDEGGGVRFGPVDKAAVERLKAKACQPLHEGENLMHSIRSPFCR